MRSLNAIFLAALLFNAPHANAQTLPQFDFTRPDAVAQWKPAHDIAGIEGVAEGMAVTLGGNDPYFFGPARDYPADVPLWMTIRLRSDTEGAAQVFFFNEAPSEEKSVRFDLTAGAWIEKRVPLPPLR